ncbi:MAG: DNA polymerase III subunit beta [Peptococcaceae bacterium]|nr:DNA polymerase III subunit beta [Peptococcaceae bacterium]
MKILCNRENLIQGVQVVLRAVSAKTTLPILSGILIKTEVDRLYLTATDLELGIDCSIPVQVIEHGSLVVPARIFSEIVKKLPDTKIELNTNNQNNILTVNYSPSQTTINCMDSEEFPVIPALEENHNISIKSSIFKSMVKQVAFSAATDENRPIFTGVLVIIENDIFKTVATDTHRLAYRNTTLEADTNMNWQAVVPAKALVEVSRLIQDDDEMIDIIFAENQINFKFGNISLLSRLIEGQFPNYKQVIPTSCKTKIRVLTKALLDATERASLVAREGSNVIKLKVQENALIITSDSADLGKVYEEVQVELQGEEAQISFNSRYLVDVLKVIDCEEIVIELTGSLSPGIIRPVDANNYLYLILPIRTN